MADSKPAAAEDDVDPAIREFQRITARDYARHSNGVDIDTATRRLIAEKVRAPWREGGPAMAQSTDIEIFSGLRLRIHRPQAAAPGRALIYLHGGGWVMFSLDTHDRLMREYAARSKTVVVGVDYSLAPEARYPRALDEVASAVNWVAKGNLGPGFENAKIILGGDSAGANLSVAAAMRARDEGKRAADGLLLNYGAFDSQERASHARFDGDDYMLTREEMAGFWAAYTDGLAPEDSLYARPLQNNVEGLPPTFMCIAECDILLDENTEMAKKLRAAGVDVTEKIYAGATHSFLEAVSTSSLANTAIDDASNWLKRF